MAADFGETGMEELVERSAEISRATETSVRGPTIGRRRGDFCGDSKRRGLRAAAGEAEEEQKPEMEAIGEVDDGGGEGEGERKRPNSKHLGFGGKRSERNKNPVELENKKVWVHGK